MPFCIKYYRVHFRMQKWNYELTMTRVKSLKQGAELSEEMNMAALILLMRTKVKGPPRELEKEIFKKYFIQTVLLLLDCTATGSPAWIYDDFSALALDCYAWIKSITIILLLINMDVKLWRKQSE